MMQAAGTLAAVPVALAGLGWPALAGAALVVLLVIATLCWTISDGERSRRLAMLIDAIRGNGRPPPAAALPAAGSDAARSAN
jgi:hypothetical protein